MIELRGVKKHGKPSKDGHKGKPWFKVWNQSMKQCRVFSDTEKAFGVQWLDEEQDIDEEKRQLDDVDDEDEEESEEDVAEEDLETSEDDVSESEESDEDLIAQKMRSCRKLNVMSVGRFSY